MPKIEVNGTELFYELTGSGEPLVLVHGSWGDHDNWTAVVPMLAESFHVLTYDRRGHSQSQRPGDGARRDDEDDLAALLEALDMAPAHIVGSSFGASIVVGLASRRPGLFRTLAVHEPPLLALAEDDEKLAPLMAEFQAKIGAVINVLETGDIPGGSKEFVETVAMGEGAWGELPEPMQQTFITNALTWLNEMGDPGMGTVDLGGLGGFTSPALVSEGDQSPPWFPAINERIAEAIPNCKRYVFAGAGHVPHLSHPEDFVAAVCTFISSVSQSARA